MPADRTWRGELRRTAHLAIPLVGASAGSQLMSLVDTGIVGRLGPTEIAANGMGTAIFFLTSILALGVVLGLDPLAAQAVGAGRPDQARRHLRDAIALAAGLSVPFGGLCFAVWWALPAIGIEQPVVDATLRFLSTRAPGMLPFLLFMAVRSYLQALGRTRPSVAAMVVGNIVNLPTAWLLIHGGDGLARLGLPTLGLPAGLGVVGAGLANTLGLWVQLGVLVLALRAEPVPEGTGRASWAGVGEILRLGVPVGLQYLAEVAVFAGTQMLVGRFGAVWAAAHNVAIQLASFTFCICLGLSQAACVRVGHEVGAKDWPAAHRAGLVGLGLGLCVMTCSGLAFFLWPVPIAELLAGPPEVVEAAATLLGIAAVFQIFDGLQAIGGGVLRGAGDTHAAMWVNVGVHWGLTAPLVLLAGPILAIGPHAMWWALTLGLALVGTGLTARFLRLIAGHTRPNS